MSSQSTTRPIIHLGMNVHKDSITIAVLPAGAKTPTRLERLPNDLPTHCNQFTAKASLAHTAAPMRPPA